MKRMFFLLILFVLVVAGVEAAFHWEYISTGRVLPPQITLEDCEDVRNEIWKYDWDHEVAFAIAKAESKCDKNAKGDTSLVFNEGGREYGYSVGVFQVRILPGREECDTYELPMNVKCAYNIYVGAGRNFTDWSMYTNGNYKNYMWHTIW